MTIPDQVIEIKANWGKGNQAIGELFCLEKEAAIFDLKGKHQGQILALKGRLKRGLWHKAKSIGIKGVICGGLPDEEFAREVEKEVLRVGEEKRKIGLPLVVFGEKGKVPEEVWQTLHQNQGKKIVIEGDKSRLLIPET